MKINKWLWQAFLLSGAAAAGQASADPGYVDLGTAGNLVMKPCNPGNSDAVTRCEVESLPGEDGYTLVGSRSTPIVKNDVTVGTVHDRVWRSNAQPNRYIFGMRVVMNADQWDPSGLAFNVNDLSRRLRPHAPAFGAYQLGGATKALISVGRTSFGLNEFDGAQPPRDNSWVDFRIDANAADPDGLSSPKSPWLLFRTRAPDGYAVQPFGVRVLNSDFPSISNSVEVFVPGYQPNGVPADDGGGDDGD